MLQMVTRLPIFALIATACMLVFSSSRVYGMDEWMKKATPPCEVKFTCPSTRSEL